MRSILTAKLYWMTYRFDIRAIIKATLGKMLGFGIPLILCINSKSLYDCLVKLSTTQRKQLIVDVMSLR